MNPITIAVLIYALSDRNRGLASPRRRRNVRVIPIPGHVLPESGILSFEFRRSPTHIHNGIDLPAPEGTPVLATADGVVRYATDSWEPGFAGYGNVVVIEHNVGVRVWTLSAHLQRANVDEDQQVKAGDVIGFVGRTQYTREDHQKIMGPRKSHLHFEVSPREYPQASTARRLDPVAWLRAGEPRV